MNKEDKQKLQKVSEQSERQAEGKEPEERTLICIRVSTQAHTWELAVYFEEDDSSQVFY